MNIDDYENRLESRYREFAAAVEAVLKKAIADAADQGIPRLQSIQSRAKEARSLRLKLEKFGKLASDKIEADVKDLAGVRLIFYTDTDVDRFLASRLIPELFEVEWRETKVHHPNPENDNTPYQAVHYVVRLGPEILAKPQYAPFAGLRCEIQIQTMLSHIWAETSHDIIYKTPGATGFGTEALKGIDKRLRKIMSEYLVPAGHEFAKVQHDYERLMQGKALFDRGTLESLARAQDNNERRDTLVAIKDYVLPNYDDLLAIYPELCRALFAAVRAARQTAPKSIPTEIGDLPGATAEQVTKLAVEILTNLRYINVEATFATLAHIYRDEPDGEQRKRIVESVEQLARPNLAVWQRVGPYIQFALADILGSLSVDDVIALRSMAVEAWSELLNSELRGATFAAESMTFSIGAVPVSDELRTLRQKAIDGLLALFDRTTTLADRWRIFSALTRATSVPTQGRASNELYALTIADATRIVDQLTGRVADQPYEFIQHVEHWAHLLYHRNKQIANDESDRFGCRVQAKQLLRAIEALRDRINSDAAFVHYKVLVGFESVFLEHWDDAEFDFTGAEAYRRERMAQYVADIRPENEGDWFKLIARCAATDSNDGATFPTFIDFLRDLSKAKPATALRLLERADEPTMRFLPAMLNGLSESAASADYEALVTRYLAAGQYLIAIAKHLNYPAMPPLAKAKAVLAKALAAGDVTTAIECIALAVQRHAASHDWISDILVPAMRWLADRSEYRWVQRVWFMQPLRDLMAQLTAEQMRPAIDTLLEAPEIGGDVERVLALIAAHHLPLVWAYFGKRLARPKAEGEGYEAVPFQFHGLEKQLAKDVALAVDTVRGWYRPGDNLFQYEGGRLLHAAVPNFTEDVSRKFSDLATNGAESDVDFILEVLPNYRGNPAIHPALMDLVSRLPAGDRRLDKIELCIEATGVVSGQFGFVEAYRAKKAAVTPWLSDGRQRVRDFVVGLIRHFDVRIASEQRTAEQRWQQRRLEFETDDDQADS